jgi:hypothetical protein
MQRHSASFERCDLDGVRFDFVQKRFQIRAKEVTTINIPLNTTKAIPKSW